MFHVKHEGLPGLLAEVGVELSPGQIAQLERYVELLADHAVPAGLVARSDADRLWKRHIGDALRGVPLIGDDLSNLCDLGSGAGLPGVVLAVACPDLEVVLTEPRRNRIAFLELVTRELRLDRTEIHAGRAELVPGPFDLCASRAMASLAATWTLAGPLLGSGGRLIYWAGAGFSLDTLPSGVTCEVHPPTSSFAGSGPLVIMGRQ